MTNEPHTIRVFIPMTFKKRNGRPKIVPPAEVEALTRRDQDPHVLRAIGRAWKWRRMLESGEAFTIVDIAHSEKLAKSFVSRNLRLAYLSPDVLRMLITERRPCPVSLEVLANIAQRPWTEQIQEVCP